jgi:hypothetical protein
VEKSESELEIGEKDGGRGRKKEKDEERGRKVKREEEK